jgi:hypothetical protein
MCGGGTDIHALNVGVRMSWQDGPGRFGRHA